jgi:protein SCO1/2
MIYLPRVLYLRATMLLLQLVLLSFLYCCTPNTNTLPYYHSANFTPLWKGESTFLVDTLHTIAPFKFIDQQGDTVTNKTFESKIYVANFFFTICPGICPKMTNNLQQVANAFKNKPILFISHSVTPDIDSVAQLKKYAQDHQINNLQWHLVTGNKQEIYSLARQSYFVEQEIGFDYTTQQFLHTEHFILVDQQGHLRGIYKGTLQLEVNRLIEDINLLLKET